MTRNRASACNQTKRQDLKSCLAVCLRTDCLRCQFSAQAFHAHERKTEEGESQATVRKTRRARRPSESGTTRVEGANP